MKRGLLFFFLIISMSLLVGCTEESFPTINEEQSFVASMNILDPSLSFYDETGEKIANWEFDQSYSGALLVGNESVLLYGHQLPEAHLYELSSGELISTIKTGLGSTNAYYDSSAEQFFMTNSETNAVTSYDALGERLGECILGEYPMSMNANDGFLYVINYKETKLSILNIETMELSEEWPIEESSNGILIIPERNEIWIGGHGEGNKPNQTVDVLNLHSGEMVKQLELSIMPINFTRNEQEVYIINHGSNELYATNIDGQTLWNIEIGANPFTVASFGEYIVVAGFDDHRIYFVEGKQMKVAIDTNSGPFQLLVREVE